MILPFGDNCFIADSLKSANIREYSYPFDWSLGDLSAYTKILLTILQTDDIDSFCDIFFNLETNTTYVQKYNQQTVFTNKEYNMSFPHDNISDIKDKYKRRFLRMKEHFYKASSVTLIIARRWSTDDEKIYHVYNELSKIRDNIRILVINGLSAPSANAHIHKIDIEYPEQHRINAQIYDNWSYDQTTYKANLANAIRTFFQS